VDNPAYTSWLQQVSTLLIMLGVSIPENEEVWNWYGEFCNGQSARTAVCLYILETGK
jgi:hypothetical protein